jgi:molybdenum cofactor synthesis domain-containing protein
LRAAIIIVSSSRTEATDESGPEIESWVASLGLDVAVREIVPDEREAIAAAIRRWVDYEGCELVVTSGGTGLAPSDVTPEATLEVLDREAPGIAEAMRLASREHTAHWMLSRAVAGVRGRTLVLNLPGAPKAVRETAPALTDAVKHALALLSGSAEHS